MEKRQISKMLFHTWKTIAFTIVKIINDRRLTTGLSLAFIGMLFCVLYFCFQVFYKESKTPYQIIKADIKGYGYLSVLTRCAYHIDIDMGNGNSSITPVNRINIYHRSRYTEKKDIDSDFFSKFSWLDKEYGDQLMKMYSFYMLDYYCHTTIDIGSSHTDNYFHHDSLTFSYVDAPQRIPETEGSSFKGSGFVAFSKSQNDSLELVGDGHMDFNTSVINGKPSLTSPWDITTANYNIQFHSGNVICDTITIEFHGATMFSNMYPVPDKTTMSGIEFTSSSKIKAIMKDGLRFHAQFLEKKGQDTIRSFILVTLISVIISFLGNILYGFLFKRE